MYKLLISLFLAIILTGCSGTRGNTLVVSNTNSYISVPADKLITVTMPSPPDKELYMKLKPIEKEKALADYAAELMFSLSKANGIIEDIKAWNNDMLKKNKGN